MTRAHPQADDPLNDPAGWIDRHGDALFRYALARVGDRTVAEDLVQDALLAGLRNARDFRGESAERTWLTGILRHKVMDHFRRLARDRRIWVESDDTRSGHDDFDAQGRWLNSIGDWEEPEQALERAEFWSVFEHCIGNLPEKLRTPFALRELDGVDSDTLASTLSVSRNNLWVMLSRARRHLRQCLERHWFSDGHRNDQM